MGQDKNNLNKLLKFIRELIQQEGNEWFHDELALMVTKSMISEKDNGILFGGVTIKEIGSIEKYIGNEIAPMINYSFIKDERLRFQLQRDCIEMDKIRLGKFQYKIDFFEFCKYAHFQAEGLINYFFGFKSGYNLSKAKDLIIAKIPSESFKKRVRKSKSINAINYSSKLIAAKGYLSIPYKTDILLQSIGEVRNDFLHRGVKDNDNFESLHEEAKKIESKEYSYRTKEEKSTYTRYRKEQIKREENYEKVYEALIQLSTEIATKI